MPGLNRLTVAGGAIALMFLALFFLRSSRLPQEKGELAASETVAAGRTSKEPSRADALSDADGDRLFNWEERLWGSDAENPDTDGDGTTDGEEADAGRNPLVPGPDDRMSGAVISRIEERRAARDAPILPRLSLPRQTPAHTAPVSTGTPPHANGAQARPENERLRQFGNALGGALAPVANESFAEQTQIALQEAVDARTAEALGALQPLAAAYGGAERALFAIAPPPEGKRLRDDMAEGYQRLSAAVSALARGETAPEELGRRWFAYSDAVMALAKALNEAIGFFLERGITFEPHEPGHIFVVSSR